MKTFWITGSIVTAILLGVILASGRTGEPGKSGAQTLTIAAAGPLTTLDPHNTLSTGDLSFLGHIYDSLTRQSVDGQIIPGIASEWEAVDDHTWRVTIDTHYSFPDTKVIDAAVVKWNLDRILDKKNGLRVRSSYRAIDHIEVDSPTQLTISTSQPFPAFPSQAASLLIMEPDWVGTHKPGWQTYGSGPYELERYNPSSQSLLKRRIDYQGKPPLFDEVIYRVIPDETARLAALNAGEVDVVSSFSPREVKQINRLGMATAVAIAGNRAMFLKYNTEIAPFKNNRTLRQALNYAVDRQGIVDAFFDGYGEPLKCQVLTESYQGYDNALTAYPFDPEKARTLLAEAGVKPGQLTLTLTVANEAYIQSLDIVQTIAAELESVGVNVLIERLDFATYMNRYVNRHAMSELMYIGQAASTLESQDLYQLYESDNPYAYYQDPVFDHLLRKLSSSFREDERALLYKQMSARLCDQAPVLFLFSQPFTVAYSKRLNFTPRKDEYVRADNFTLAKASQH